MSKLTFAANLTMLFGEVPLPDRFEAARSAGFATVEMQFPYDWPVDLLKRRIEREGLNVALINLPAGDWDAGDRGLAALPGRQEEFRASVETALAYARALDVPRMHCMAGIVPPDAARTEIRTLYLDNVAYAARRCAEEGIDILIEPINGHDVPGYFLDSFAAAAHHLAAIRARGARARLLFDIYHCARLHGDVTPWLAALAHEIGHYQIAGAPSRHEPDIGSLPYAEILADACHLTPGLTVGLEYRPRGRTEDGLGWLAGLSMREPVSHA
ncbi:MAG: hydroxypyruvate isomerase family protein [Rubricella sp.]